MVEVMGQKLEKAFEGLGIEAVKAVETKERKYQVWQMNDEDYKVIDAVPNEDWKDDWGWWRKGGCIYEGGESYSFTVNGQPMKGYLDEDDDEIKDWHLSGEYKSYTDWMHDVMSLSAEKNLVIFAESLAIDNGLSLSEFISKFEN